MNKIKQLNWRSIICLFLIWRVLLFGLALLAPIFFAYQPTFVAPDSLFEYGLADFVAKWASFDGVHYLSIAQEGYKAIGLIQAFFPLYPLMIRYLDLLIANPLLSALIISNLASLMVLVLINLIFEPKIGSKKTQLLAILLLIFPTSFYFGAAYSESLFLLWILASFYFFEEKKWPLMALAMILASATRVVGVFLVPAFMLQLFWQNKGRFDWRANLWILLGSLGLLAYMFYLWQNFSDPLYFLHVQDHFGTSRQSSLILWPQVFWRYIKILVTVRPIDWKYYIYSQEFLISLWSLWILLRGLVKRKVSLAWSVFALLAYFLPPLTGNFSSMPRYVLVCLAIFIYLTNTWEQNKNWQKILYLTISLILLIINCMLFIQGHWVA